MSSLVRLSMSLALRESSLASMIPAWYMSAVRRRSAGVAWMCRSSRSSSAARSWSSGVGVREGERQLFSCQEELGAVEGFGQFGEHEVVEGLCSDRAFVAAQGWPAGSAVFVAASVVRAGR